MFGLEKGAARAWASIAAHARLESLSRAFSRSHTCLAPCDASCVHKTTRESQPQVMSTLEPQDAEHFTRKLRLVMRI